jgi:hypothetical protein
VVDAHLPERIGELGKLCDRGIDELNRSGTNQRLNLPMVHEAWIDPHLHLGGALAGVEVVPQAVAFVIGVHPGKRKDRTAMAERSG